MLTATQYLVSGVGVGILHWRYQHVGIIWRYLTLKLVSPPTPNPDTSQWTIDGVGPSGVGAGIGHVHFIFFCVDFICVWWSTQTQYPVEYDPREFKSICGISPGFP